MKIISKMTTIFLISNCLVHFVYMTLGRTTTSNTNKLVRFIFSIIRPEALILSGPISIISIVSLVIVSIIYILKYRIVGKKEIILILFHMLYILWYLKFLSMQ